MKGLQEPAPEFQTRYGDGVSTGNLRLLMPTWTLTSRKTLRHHCVSSTGCAHAADGLWTTRLTTTRLTDTSSPFHVWPSPCPQPDELKYFPRVDPIGLRLSCTHARSPTRIAPSSDAVPLGGRRPTRRHPIASLSETMAGQLTGEPSRRPSECPGTRRFRESTK